MRLQKIYLDTTIPSYMFNVYVPDKQEASKRLFELIRLNKYETYISPVVISIREVMNTSDSQLRDKLAKEIKEISVLEVTEECMKLEEEYIKNRIVPIENRDDALHIAIASIYDMDFLISYNFEHIVKISTIDKVTGVNLLLGYGTPRIVTSEEVL